MKHICPQCTKNCHLKGMTITKCAEFSSEKVGEDLGQNNGLLSPESCTKRNLVTGIDGIPVKNTDTSEQVKGVLEEGDVNVSVNTWDGISYRRMATWQEVYDCNADGQLTINPDGLVLDFTPKQHEPCTVSREDDDISCEKGRFVEIKARFWVEG